MSSAAKHYSIKVEHYMPRPTNGDPCLIDRDGDFEATDDVLVTFCTGVISLAGQPLVTPTKG